MRILIPAHRIPDNFADNVAHTLGKMGHEVHTLPPRQVFDPRMRASGVRDSLMRRLVRGYVTGPERQALALAREIRPDMVLALTQQLASETLMDLKRMGVRHRVVWWGDAPANMQQMGVLDDEWDVIFFKDFDCVRKLQRVGLNAHLLHEAHNPDWHRPLAGVASDRVVVAGNFYGHRQFIVRRLLDREIPLDLYGPPLPRWVDPEIAKVHHGRYLVREDKSRVFGEGVACLNSMHIVEGNALNCRAFEIAGAAGLQLIEQRSMIEACFEPGKEVLVFDNLPELLEHIERARNYPAEVAKVREAGHRRAVAQHTYKHRLEQILREVAES
jgi:spore maturation protein CgeB